MKKLNKLLVIALALVLMLALVACDRGSGNKETTGNSDETGAPDTPSESNSDTNIDSTQPGSDDTSNDTSNDTSKDTSNDPSDVTTDPSNNTEKPDEPKEPEDPDKTAKIVDSVNQAVEALASSMGGQIGSQIPEVSLDTLVELFKTLDLEITGIPNIKDAVIVKNGMVAYSQYSGFSGSIDGQESADSVSKHIFKLYSNGALNITTEADGQMYGDFSPFDFSENSGIELPNASIDFTSVLNALKLTKDDIKADVEKQTYTFSEDYLTRVSNAIYGLFEEIGGEQISVFGVNENNIISSLVLDFGKLESEGKVSATAKIGKTGKEIAVDITVGDTSFGMSVECKELFTFNMKLAVTQDAITSFELNAEVPTENIKLAVKVNFAQTTSFEATLSDLDSGISVTGTCKTDANGKTTVDADISIRIKTVESSDGISSESTEKIDVKLVCTVTPDANGAPDINVSVSVKTDGTEIFKGELYFSISAITTPSKECASLNLIIYGSAKFDASIKTVAYSEKGFEYQVNIGYSDGNGSSEKFQISVKAPSTLEIELTDAEKLYIGNADKIAADYQKVLDKIDELNALAIAYAGSSYDPENGDPYYFFTDDKETGLVYITYISEIWDKDDYSVISYEVYTYVELGSAEDYREDVTENLGDFKTYKKPASEIIRQELESVLESESGKLDELGYDLFVDFEDGKDYGYYVCCQDTDTGAYYVFQCTMYYIGYDYVKFDSKPTAEEIGSTNIHWYTLGSGKLHNFVESDNTASCEGCGTVLSKYPSFDDFEA